MQVRALRGVCIGPGRHLLPAETADLDPATVQFLTSIGAVERLPEPQPAEQAPAATDASETPAPPKGGKKEK